MTVNEIPDFRKKHTQSTTTLSSTTTSNQHSQKLQRSQSVIPGQSSQYLQVALPTASSSSQTLNRNHRSQTHENISIPHHHQVTRELLYDTASTATTITPPCSESGRDTPHQQQHISNISSATLTTRQKRETFGGMASASQSSSHQQPSNRSLSIQSLNYPQTVRTSQSTSNRISNSTTEDEDNIPYHAREHSQPFSYGNIIPNGEPDPRMIKAQTGLTSPTLVRKAFNNRLSSTSSTSNLSYNTASTMRKNQIDSDFEDMLRERRDKKYSISDKQRANGYQSHPQQQQPQQSYYTTTETLRRTHQPLMDRSMSSEE